MEDYKEKYEETIAKIKDFYQYDVNSETAKRLEVLFPELCDSEDEKIRKNLIAIFKGEITYTSEEDAERYIAWLEKQKELKTIQWTGDNLKEVTKFTGLSPEFNNWFKSWDEYESYVHSHNDVFKLFFEDGSHYEVPKGAWIIRTPDGYNVASRSKYIEKNKPMEEVDGEEYGIDGLWHAERILEKTLGEVEGYQSDDGILEHKAAIDAIKKLYKLKHNTKKPYPGNLDEAIDLYYYSYGNGKNGFDNLSLENFRDIVKMFIEDYGNSVDVEWSEEDKEMLNNCIELMQDIDCTQAEQNWLRSLKPQQKQEWSEEDEFFYTWCVSAITTRYNDGLFTTSEYKQTKLWLQSLKDRVQPQPKQEWSEEDNNMLNEIIEDVMPVGECPDYPTEEEKEYFYKGQDKVDWLKSIKPQPRWTPSEEQIYAFKTILDSYKMRVNDIVTDYAESLYNDINYMKKIQRRNGRIRNHLL